MNKKILRSFLDWERTGRRFKSLTGPWWFAISNGSKTTSKEGRLEVGGIEVRGDERGGGGEGEAIGIRGANESSRAK